MKVLELCLSPGHGGLELYMVRTARELARRHEVFSVIRPGPGVVRDALEEAGLDFMECRLRLPELPLLGARVLARLLDERGIDAMHVHYRRDLPLAALAKRWSRRRPRLVYTSQMKMSHDKRDPYHAFIYGEVDALLTITAQLREQVRQRLPPALRERVRLLYYGTAPPPLLDAAALAALRREHGLAEGRFTVGIFGQKHEGKGQPLLLEALGRLRAAGMDAQLLIVGPETQPGIGQRLREDIAARGMTGDVAMLDFVTNAPHLMQLCDVVVLATWQETFGLVLIEAMSVGTAVIGSNAGGVPEIIDDGETGLLFATRDADSLAAQLRRLHDDPALRARLAAAGQRRAAERFSVAKHYADLEAILRGEWPPEVA